MIPEEHMPFPREYPHDSEETVLLRAERGQNHGCLRCGTPLHADFPNHQPNYHTTMISDREGMLPLCSPCWEKLTPETRLPYYLSLLSVWGSGFDVLDSVVRALKEGK